MVVEKKETSATQGDYSIYESMIKRFDVAAKIIGLDEETYNILKTPQRRYVVSLPVAGWTTESAVFGRLPHHPQHQSRTVERRHSLCTGSQSGRSKKRLLLDDGNAPSPISMYGGTKGGITVDASKLSLGEPQSD